MNLPAKTHTMQCHHFDSTRWDYYEPRDDDIIVATSYKAGTTWTQAILSHLLFPDGNFPASPEVMSPWLDFRMLPLEMVLNELKGQHHRRFIKTHLPLYSMRYEENVKYLYVTRDGRDVFMSMWNHYKNQTEETIFGMMNGIPGREGDEMPLAPDDIHEFWETWVTKSWFDHEESGWPYWSHLANVQSWWDYRHLPNIKLVHYNDLLAEPEATIRDMADYLGIEVQESDWPRIVEAISFKQMKANSALYAPGGGVFWKGGADTFINKGTNGRWREVLSDEELAQYDAACDRALTPECRAWLEKGGSFT